MAAFYLVACNNRDEPPEVKVEIKGANEFEPKGKGTIREVYAEVDVGDGYTATAAKGWFKDSASEDIKFVEFAIIYKINNGSLVAFRKAIAINDLPDDVLNLPINEIVSVTDDEIIFEIGAVKITSERPRGHSLK